MGSVPVSPLGGFLKRTVLLAVCAIAATAAAAQWHYLSGGKLSGVSSVGSHVWAVGQERENAGQPGTEKHSEYYAAISF